MKIAILILLGIVLVMFGCQMNNAPERPADKDIIYFQDSRTGLCFAAMNSASYGWTEVTSITSVPCSEKVEQLIEEK